MNATVPRAVSKALIPLIAATLVAMVLGLIFGGAGLPQLLVDPGPAVRYGLPTAKAFVNIGAALSLGSLLLAAFALPKGQAAYSRALGVSALGAGVWTISAVVGGFATFLAVFLEPVSLEPRFGEVLWLFVSQTEVGRAWLTMTVIAATVTVLSVVVRSYPLVFATGVLAVAGLWPLAEQGHAAGTAGHQIAVSSSFVHGVFAAFWVGGLVMLAIAHWSDKSATTGFLHTLERYSTIALVSFIAVAASGVTNAVLRVGSFEGLLSPYGFLVLGKFAALVGLGAFGLAYRRTLIQAVRNASAPSPRKGIIRVVVAELGLMGVAMGLAVALSRTATPVPQVPAGELTQATPAEILTGELLPPEFEWWRVFTEWKIDLLWALLVAFAVFFYIAGHYRLAKRGDHWPVFRTVSFVFGMLVLALATNSGLAVYGTYLFSVHMVSHMLLGMAVPVLLVLSAPVTLASRAIIARKDGSRGAREWILSVVHSRYLGVLGHPLVASVIFAISLIVFYYSPLFEWALREHLGHQWMILHFVFTGYLFAQALVGVDPNPHNPPYPLRLIIVLATMAFHAFFGLSLIYGTGLLAPDWYGAMGREWGLDPLADQQQGGELAWGLGEIPTLILAILVTYGWMKSDDRANKRRDRLTDRQGDLELDAYNEMLSNRATWKTPPNKG